MAKKKKATITAPKAKKLPSGKWRCQLMINKQSVSITRESRKEAEEEAFRIKMEYRQKGDDAALKYQRVTLSDAIDNYIQSRENVLSPATLRGYRIIQRNRFKAVMNTDISTVRNWQKVVNDEAKLCSAKTLKNSWGFIKSVLQEQKSDPGKVTLPQIVAEEHSFLDYEQILYFVESIKGHKYELSFLLALHSLRVSEILAIKGESGRDTLKNISDGVIHVRGAAVPGQDHKIVFKITNKNITSRRNIPVFIPRLNELIAEYGKYCKNQIPKTSQTLTKNLRKHCKYARMPYVGMHGLRHSFASLCYHLGLSEMETMELGGWSNPGTMRKIYTHLSKGDRSKAATKLLDFFTEREAEERNSKTS